MAYTPPPHTPNVWHDAPLTDTPLDAAHLEAAEDDLVSYTQQAVSDLDSYLEGLIGGSAQALVPTAVKTADYTAVAADFVPVDISAGSVTIALPSAPDKTRIGVKLVKVDGSHTNTCTVTRAGSDVFNIASGSTSLTLSALFQGVLLQYKASSGIWYVSTADTPVGQPNAAASLGADGKHKSSEIPSSVVSASPAPINPIHGVRPVANLTDPRYGANADAIQATGGAIASGTNTLTIDGGFVGGDVGKFVMLPGAGPTLTGSLPSPFTAYIGTVVSGTAHLVTTKGGSTAANASNTVTATNITYGSAGLSAAVSQAVTDGLEGHLPEGSYVWDTQLSGLISTPLRLSGTGHATTVYFPSNITLGEVQGPGLQGSSAALSSDAVMGDLSLAAASIPAGLVPGDYIYLASTDLFDVTGEDTTCKNGEFLRVFGISGTTVYLNSPVRSPVNYHTSPTIQKISFLNGCKLEQIKWINGTPEKWTGGTFPASQTISAGGGKGFVFRFTTGTRVREHEATGWAGHFVDFVNSIRCRAENLDFKDGAFVPANPGPGSGSAYGYGIGVSGSAWCQLAGGSLESGHAFVDFSSSGGTTGDLSMPAADSQCHGVTARNGYSEVFATHKTAMWCDFVNCTILGGVQAPPDTTHAAGFHVAGRYCKVIDPVITNVTGIPIALYGADSEVIRPIIRHVYGWNNSSGTATGFGIYLNAARCRVVSVDIDDVKLNGTAGGGIGILIATSSPNCEITGHNVIRNTAKSAIFVQDTSNTERIDSVLGINNGRYVIESAGSAPSNRWANVTGVNYTLGLVTPSSGLTATPVIGNYQSFTSSTTFVVPASVTKIRGRCISGGGGGGGGGTSSGGTTNAGGSGGAGGTIVDGEITVTPGETLTITIGTAGNAGNAGVAGGNVGGNGGQGGATQIVNGSSVTLLRAPGGMFGLGGPATSSTPSGAGLYGSLNNSTSAANSAGSGAASAGTTPGPFLYVVGGAGGGNSSASLGGNGGNAQQSTAFLASQSAGTNAGQGTSAGGAGVTATQPGCGGGGGGGGTAGTGAGGAGGAGAPGLIELWW